MRQYERDKSFKVELKLTEFLKLPGEKATKATSGNVQVSHLVTLPSIPVHNEDVMKRFMRGPWITQGQPQRSVASDEVKRLERQLYQLLRGLRTRIAEEFSSMLYSRVV